MNRISIVVTLLMAVLVILVQPCQAQTKKDEALAKAKEALRLEDEEGKYDDAIRLLKEANELDPGGIAYPYELAYAYSGKKDYKAAAEVLERLLVHKDVTGRVYQMLGNTYDHQGLPEKAITTYETGLRKFPNAGELYLELGNMKLAAKKYGEALAWYEKGIGADPRFASNYYHAARLYCSSTEEVWGMIYGELFMNLERNSKRTREISKLLYDTYRSEIKFTSDTSYSVSFSQVNSVNVADLKDPKNFMLPFPLAVYEMHLMLAIVNETGIDISSMDRIRTRFLDMYMKGEHRTTYPNALFEYQQKVKQAGHLEAYNHWLLMMGDEAGYDVWAAANSAKETSFVEWFRANPLQLDRTNKFTRGQYE